MNDDAKATLATIERCVVRDAVSVHAALQAAYNLGRVDGQLEMAKISSRLVEELIPHD